MIKVILFSSITMALLALVLFSENESPTISLSKSSNIKIDSSAGIGEANDQSRKTVLPNQNSRVSQVANSRSNSLPKGNAHESIESKKEDFLDEFTTGFVADGYTEHEVGIAVEIVRLAYINRNPDGSVNLIDAVDKISEELPLDSIRKSRLNELVLDALALNNRITLDEHAICVRQRAKAFPECVQSGIEDYIKTATENSPDRYLRYNQATVELTEKFAESLSKTCSQSMSNSKNLLNLDIRKCD